MICRGAADEQVRRAAILREGPQFGFPRQPRKDVVVKEQPECDVVNVDAYATGCCNVILQDRSEALTR